MPRPGSNKQRARAWRQLRAWDYTRWVRTPARTWKVFQRDEKHKWRRRTRCMVAEGGGWLSARYGWEYGSDLDVARQSIAALSGDPSQTQEEEHD